MTLWISIYLPVESSLQRTRLEAIATTLLQYTPELAVFDSRSLLLDIGASLSLFKGPRNLCRRIQCSLNRLGVQARISMAPTAAGAWLLARQDQTPARRTLRMATLARRLNRLQIRHLPVAAPYQDWLDAIGCITLKQLNQLPRAGLRQRTSPEIIKYLDAAYGKAPLHLHWYQAADTFRASCLLDFHTTYTHSLLTVAHGLIEQLCGWLQARRHSAFSMQFSLHHEKGRQACPPTCITLSLSTPSRYAKDFLLLLKEQLQHERLHAPVIAIDLHQVHSQPECEPSGDLFPDRSQARHQEGQLIDLLRARLGYENILQPSSIASYVPEYANQWTTTGSVATPTNPKRDSKHKASASAPIQPGPPLTTSSKNALTAAQHPFWMLDHPIELDTHNDHPFYMGHTLHLVQGPERIENGWWMDGYQKQRDYFVARDARHCRYWIYRQRGSDTPSWFLHGLFA